MSSARERLQQVQQELGLAAKKSLGQNFLVSDLVIERIIQAVRDCAPRALIEVGPGPGALTYFLKQMNLPLQLIELDRDLASYWRDQGLSVIEADALRLDWAPLVSDPQTVLVSNLPYQISSSLVIERSIEGAGVSHMVLMFQKEVAQRIRARPRTEEYGLLSVIAQNFWHTEMVTEAGPKDFAPPPRVASRVLSFRRLGSPVRHPSSFLRFVKAGFAQRRKLLKSNLSDLARQKQVSPEILVGWLQEMGFKETARAEELSPAQFVQLYRKFGFEE